MDLYPGNKPIEPEEGKILLIRTDGSLTGGYNCQVKSSLPLEKHTFAQ